MQGLPVPVIVQAGPTGHGPDVVELPYHGAHAGSPEPPEMLHPIADGLGLEQLGAVEQLVEIPGIEVGLGQVVQNLAVGRGVPLVQLHDPGIHVPVLGFREPADGLQGREGLEAELRQEAVVVLPVSRKAIVVPQSESKACSQPQVAILEPGNQRELNRKGHLLPSLMI